VPLVEAPVYSATKPAVHSFTISLRRQMANSSISVVELIPPVVETDLHRGQSRKPPRALRLDAFVKAAMAGLEAGLEAGHPEVRVVLAYALAAGSRIAPGLFLNIVNTHRD
jgi:uncharacterized oxidoreductase